MRMFARCAALFGSASIVGLATNAMRPDGISIFGGQVAAVCEVPDAVVAALPPAEAETLCGRGTVLIVDVRPEAEFIRGHIPDALHLPCRDRRLGDETFAQLAAAPSILVYGQSTDEARLVAESLAKRGLPTHILDGGYPGWEAAGLACSSGPCETCLMGKLDEH